MLLWWTVAGKLLLKSLYESKCERASTRHDNSQLTCGIFSFFFILSTCQPLAKHRLSSKQRLISGSALSLTFFFFHLHTK